MLAAILSQLKVVTVIVAALAGWIFGALWYWALGRQWAKSLQRTLPAGTLQIAPALRTMVISLVAELVMATMLFGIVFHIGEVNVERALFSAVMLWIGFRRRRPSSSTTVSPGIPGPWSLIDAGHWLGVLLVMGLVIGPFRRLTPRRRPNPPRRRIAAT